MKVNVGADARSEAAQRHAVCRVVHANVRLPVAHVLNNGRTFETNWPHRACRVEIEHIEHVTEVKPCSLHREIHLTMSKSRQLLNVLNSDEEIVDRTWAAKMQLNSDGGMWDLRNSTWRGRGAMPTIRTPPVTRWSQL